LQLTEITLHVPVVRRRRRGRLNVADRNIASLTTTRLMLFKVKGIKCCSSLSLSLPLSPVVVNSRADSRDLIACGMKDDSSLTELGGLSAHR